MSIIKPVLILERTQERLNLNESVKMKNGRKQYIMEGVFTQFMQRNRNDRVYTPDKFLPHLEELLGRKQELGVVYGEFDHPDVFDTSLSRVSHVIENAKYIKEHNRVDGAVRLTNTYWGKEAQALVDDEFPLFISSRAAGVTESNGVVEVKKLFTYDIVADPGFSSAKLSMKVINESCGFDNTPTSPIRIYDLSDTSKTNELFMENKNDFKTQADLMKFMDYLTKEVAEVKNGLAKKVTESSKGDISASAADIEKMSEYQEALHETMAHIIKYLDYISENITISLNETTALNKKTDAIVEHNDYLSTEIEKSINYGTYISEKLNQSIHFGNYLGNKVNESIQFGNYIVEHLNNNINYGEYITEHLNKSIRFGNYLSEQLDTTIGYTELLAEQVNNSLEYADYIREQVNMNINYTEKVGKSMNRVIDYAHYISETLDTTIAYTELIGEKLSNTMDYADYVVECADKTMLYADKIRQTITKNTGLLTESINIPSAEEFLEETDETDTIVDPDKKEEEEGVDKMKDTDEEIKKITESVQFKTGNISKQIDVLIAEAMKTEASKEEEPHFYLFLTKEDIKSFESLSNSDKETVKIALKESQGYWMRSDVLNIMQSVLSKPTSETPINKLMKAMPDDIKPVWESITDKEKSRLLAESTIYVLETDEERTNFWSTRKVGVVNESKRLVSHADLIMNDTLSDNDVQGFMSKFKMLG
jgi:hypothetical protein